MLARLSIAVIALATLASAPITVSATAPVETVTPQFSHDIPNLPGTSLIAALVTYPPGGASPADDLLRLVMLACHPCFSPFASGPHNRWSTAPGVGRSS
jgi:hypothetical protein